MNCAHIGKWLSILAPSEAHEGSSSPDLGAPEVKERLRLISIQLLSPVPSERHPGIGLVDPRCTLQEAALRQTRSEMEMIR